MFDWAKEKLFDGALDRIKDNNQLKALQEDIESQLNREQGFFENCTSEEVFDFQGLKDCLLTKLMEEKTLAGFAIIEKTKRDKIKELIQNECICAAKAETKPSKDRVRAITDNCFSIVDNFLRSRVSIENSALGGQIADNVNEHTDEAIDNAEKNISQKIDALGEKIDSQIPAPAQSEKITFKNDNQAYLDAFTNPLFLEDEDKDEHVVSLAEMYISPSIKDKDIKASECIKKWYGTRTKPCLLIYGDAGVGKSSFVSKILADANGITEKSKTEFIFDSSKVMAVALRNHTDNINIQLTAEEILTMLFNCDFAEQLKDKLLILDGLDELCVLKHGFEGKIFLEKLSRLGYGYHVLVTSRESESYFTEPCNEEGLKTERLVWEEKQIKDWLNLYKAQKLRKEKWCIKFHEQFCSLETDDTRREIFCVPIILYICGTSETDIVDHSSIGSIYRDAFNKILLRNHLRGQSNTEEIKEADKETNITAWQFTKELAYQMFLVDSLDLVDDDTSTDRRAVGFRNAQKRTKDILKEKYKIEEPNLDIKKELAVCPFTKENEMGGITFAHKTVYEYFTAVKLYEDYFARFDADYFKANDNDTAAKEVMESFIEAFRYDSISNDIFTYLCEMKEAPFSATLGYSKRKGLNYEEFEQAFVYGMKNHTYANTGFKSAVNEYLYPSIQKTKKFEVLNTDWLSKHISYQLSTALANFTWFLTGHGFNNKDRIKECKYICNYLHGSSRNAYLNHWHFENAFFDDVNLKYAYLRNANFTMAILKRVHLEGADLTNAIFIDADLKDVHLLGADVTGTNWSKANLKNVSFMNLDLTNAKFQGAKLRNNDLSNANLTGANLAEADLTGALLTNVQFQDADLTNTILKYADLQYAYLIDVDLQHTDLTEAKLKGARYCTATPYKTFFPDSFNPKEHGMIEIDIYGQPVNDK